MFLRVLTVLLFSLTASAHKPDCKKVVQHAKAKSWEPIRLLATSVGSAGLSTVGVRGPELLTVSDQMIRVGRRLLPEGSFSTLSLGTSEVRAISGLAVLNQSTSRLEDRSVVALTDHDGGVLVAYFEDGKPQRKLPIRTSDGVGWPAGLALTDGRAPQLVLFARDGVWTANLPRNANRPANPPVLVERMSGLKGGIALQRDDFVTFDGQGTVSRLREGRTERLAKSVRRIVSLSGYLVDRQLRLWAVDAEGGLLCWNSANRQLAGCPYRLPPGVRAVNVAASAALVEDAMSYDQDWSSGFLSRRRPTRAAGDRVERLLILGDDGLLYSPFSVEEIPRLDNLGDLDESAADDLAPGSLMPLTLSPSFENLVASLDVDPTVLRRVRGSPVTPGEISIKIRELNDGRVDRPTRNHLLRVWLDRHANQRAIEMPGTGVAETFDKLGLPQDLGLRLIFLDCLPERLAKSVTMQWNLNENWEELLEMSGALRLSQREFLERSASGIPEYSAAPQEALQNLFSKLRLGSSQGEIERFLRRLGESRSSHSPVLEALRTQLTETDRLWRSEAGWTGQNDTAGGV